MAIGNLPPWINIGPTDYLQAIQSGTQAGLEVSRQRMAAQEAAARRALAEQESQRSAWEFGENLRQRAALAAAENEQQREYQAGMLDWRREQMRMDAEKAAMGDQEAQARLAETRRHNLATEGISMEKAEALARRGEAQIVSHPEAPGYLFLRNPSGSEAVITRPEKDLTDPQKMAFTFRAFNAMKPGAMTDESSPMWQAQTNYAGKVLSDLGALPKQNTDLGDLSEIPPIDVSGSGIPSLPPLAPMGFNPSLAPSAGTTESATESVETAPSVSERVSGQVYLTPKGQFKWTGSGWVKP